MESATRSGNGPASTGTLPSQLSGISLATTTTRLADSSVLLHLTGMIRSEFFFFHLLFCACVHSFSVREGLRRGTQDITAADLPTFLWPDGAFYTEDAYQGFLRNELLVSVRPYFFCYNVF